MKELLRKDKYLLESILNYLKLKEIRLLKHSRNLDNVSFMNSNTLLLIHI
jgi:hypothetical protein